MQWIVLPGAARAWPTFHGDAWGWGRHCNGVPWRLGDWADSSGKCRRIWWKQHSPPPNIIYTYIYILYIYTCVFLLIYWIKPLFPACSLEPVLWYGSLRLRPPWANNPCSYLRKRSTNDTWCQVKLTLTGKQWVHQDQAKACPRKGMHKIS